MDKLVMYCAEIEAFWREAFLENTSMVNLTLSNFPNNYSYGDKFLMALKQRKTRLYSLKLDSFNIYDNLLYYFTAVVRRHYYFESLTLSGKCFEANKDEKKLPKADQSANFQALNEVFLKNFKHLTLSMTDEHMYKGDANAFEVAMQNFKGEWLTLENGFLPNKSMSNIFVNCDRLRYFEMRTVEVNKVRQMDDILRSLANVPTLIGLKITGN